MAPGYGRQRGEKYLRNGFSAWNGHLEWVFQTANETKGAMNTTSLLRILRRLGYTSRLNDFGIYFTTHGFRGMATTILYEKLEYLSMVVELQLAHIDYSQG